MGWLSDIVGGTILRVPKIQSPGYVAGTSGWSINQDGTVEFNNGTFRGTVTAGTFQGTDYVINSQGAFFYSGAPALGNLIVSLAPDFGTDAYGNAFVKGLGLYGNGQIQVDANVGNSIMVSHETGDVNQKFELFATGLMEWGGGVNPADTSLYRDSAGSLTVKSQLKAEVSGSVETWHALPLTNGWSNSGNPPAAQYRKIASPPNSIEVVGRVSHAAVSGTSQLASILPAAYAPNHTQDLPAAVFGNTAAPVASPVLTLDNTGILTLFDLPTGTTSVAFHNIYSLDA